MTFEEAEKFLDSVVDIEREAENPFGAKIDVETIFTSTFTLLGRLPKTSCS